MSFLLLLLLVWVPCGFFAAAIADDKSHEGFAWFWGGLLCGPIGLLAAAGLSDRKQRRILRLMAEGQGIAPDHINPNHANVLDRSVKSHEILNPKPR